MRKTRLALLLTIVLGLTACYVYSDKPADRGTPASKGEAVPTTQKASAEVMARAEKADFAAGCFWGSEATFRQVPGVLATEVGFEGGKTVNPTYRDVCTDETDHAETVRVVFDPEQVSYQKLLEIFFENHDPTEVNRQGPDTGTQYRSVIFYHSDQQKKLAEAEKQKRDKSGDYVAAIATAVLPSKDFYRAEDYHQQYFEHLGEHYTCHLGNGKKKL